MTPQQPPSGGLLGLAPGALWALQPRATKARRRFLADRFAYAVRQIVRMAGRSNSADTAIPPSSAQNAAPIPPNTTPELAITNAITAPIGTSLSADLRSESMSEVSRANPAMAGTNPGGNIPTIVPAVAAQRPRPNAN